MLWSHPLCLLTSKFLDGDRFVCYTKTEIHGKEKNIMPAKYEIHLFLHC